jgi:hypothetical protein
VAVDRGKIDPLMRQKPSVTQVTVTFFLQGQMYLGIHPKLGYAESTLQLIPFVGQH